MKKEMIILASALSLFGCGGGSDNGSDKVDIINPPPAASADHPISSSILVQYSSGDYIQYDGRIKLRESDTYVGFDQSATVLLQFQNLSNPVDISENHTFLISQVATLESGDIVADKYQAAQTEELGLYVFYNEDQSEYNCVRYEVNDKCLGLLNLPGEYFKSNPYTQSGTEGEWDSFIGRFDKKYSVTHTLQMDDISIIDTQLGSFEVYPMKVTYLRENLYFPTLGKSIVGTYWVHPSIGIIKADYVRKEGNDEIYEVSYSIVDTNLGD